MITTAIFFFLAHSAPPIRVHLIKPTTESQQDNPVNQRPPIRTTRLTKQELDDLVKSIGYIRTPLPDSRLSLGNMRVEGKAYLDFAGVTSTNSRFGITYLSGSTNWLQKGMATVTFDKNTPHGLYMLIFRGSAMVPSTVELWHSKQSATENLPKGSFNCPTVFDWEGTGFPWVTLSVKNPEGLVSFEEVEIYPLSKG